MSLDLEKHLVARANELFQPLTGNFELTPCCNLHCDMCFIRHTQQEMKAGGGLRDADSWIEIARQLQQMGTLFILLTGGEPMSHPQFDTIYTTLRSMGFILTINTNGTMVTEEMCKNTFRERPRRVNVTLYGSTSNTYEKLCHNREGYERTVRGLHLLREHDIDTKLNLSMVQANAKEYEEMMDLASQLSIPVVSDSYMYPVRRGHSDASNVTDSRLSPSEAARMDNLHIRYKQGSNYDKVAHNILFKVREGTPCTEGVTLDCRAGRSAMWVSWDHHVSPCVMMETPCIDLSTGETTAFDPTGAPRGSHPVDATQSQSSASIPPNDLSASWTWLTQACSQLPAITDCIGCRLKHLCKVCYAAALHEKRQCGSLRYLCDMAEAELSILKSDEKDSDLH